MNIVCVSTIDWDELWQRHQEFMSHLANSGNNIVFVENMGFRRLRWSDLGRLWRRMLTILNGPRGSGLNAIPPQITLITPRVFPPGTPLSRLLNKKWLLPRLWRRIGMMGMENVDLAYIYLPSWSSVDFIDIVQPQKVVFDCVANFRGHPDCPIDFENIERELLSRTDLVITDSDYLTGLMKEKHPRVIQIHQGVHVEGDMFPHISKLPLPVSYKNICFFGTIDQRIDWVGIQTLINNDISVSLIGAKKVNIPDGINWIGPQPRKELYRLIANFDALIIPYKESEFSSGIVPAKLFECLATGKPTLVSPLPYVTKYEDVLYVCSNPTDYFHTIVNLPDTESPEKRRKRMEIARGHSAELSFSRLANALDSIVGHLQ